MCISVERELWQSSDSNSAGEASQYLRRNGAPERGLTEFLNLAGAICSMENPAHERNPGLERTRMDAI
jgi:hypothetical protein